MKIILDKADPITKDEAVPDTIIEITEALPECQSLTEAEVHYKAQAELLEKALSGSICQGVRHQLLILMLKHAQCLYRGV